MKSIANQYRDLKEGKLSQANFMRNLRMTMPQYITNVTSFNDAVRILKNKAILTEAALGENNLLDEVESEMENGNSYAEAIAAVAAKHNISEDKLATMVPEEAVGDKAYADNYDEMYEADDEDDELEAMIKKMEQEKEGEEAIMSQYDPMEEEQLNEYEHTYRKIGGVCYKIDDEGNRTRVADHYCRYSEELNEGKGKELHPNQIHPQELRMGIKVELEHTDDLDKAKKIALDHLAENPFYYTALKLSGIESPSAPKVKAPEEKKVKKKKEAVELVDKANAMQKVKDIKKKLKEARLNLFPNEEPNAVVKQVMGYVDGPNANPTLKAISDDIELQQSHDPNEALLKYRYWKELPSAALEKLELQFNVEVDSDFDEDTGELLLYSLTPKNKGGVKDLGASFDKFKSQLEEIVREVVNEYYFDGRDNLADEIAAQQK